jgi:hypothetical protein
VSNAAIKKDLAKFYITAARQVEVPSGQSAYVIFVPFKLFRSFKNIQKTLVGELEKRFVYVTAGCWLLGLWEG